MRKSDLYPSRQQSWKLIIAVIIVLAAEFNVHVLFLIKRPLITDTPQQECHLITQKTATPSITNQRQRTISYPFPAVWV